MSRECEDFQPYESFERKCKLLLKEEEIRFAGIINGMGRLLAGGFKDGITPLEDDSDRQKLYMELALRVSMRRDFDNSLGAVKYSASRREKVVMVSFPIGSNILLVSADPDTSIDNLANKVSNTVGSS